MTAIEPSLTRPANRFDRDLRGEKRGQSLLMGLLALREAAGYDGAVSREARGFWPVDRPATWLRRQGAKASPETGTIGLTSEQEAAWDPSAPRGFSFSGQRLGPGAVRREESRGRVGSVLHSPGLRAFGTYRLRLEEPLEKGLQNGAGFERIWPTSFKAFKALEAGFQRWEQRI
jgi:hypothetical protein